MRINTLGRKKILSFYLFLSVFGFVLPSSAQCPTISSPNQSFCDSQSPTIASLVATNTGGGVQWYTVATGGQPLVGSQTLNDGITYYVDDVAGTCSPRPSVTVSIYSRPPAIGGSITFCEDSTIADLSPYVIGNQIKWYSALTGGVQLDASTVLVDGATYYASQTNPNTGCETTRRGFSVAIVIAPVPTGDTAPVFCSLPLPTVSDLEATGPNIFWYLTSNSGLELDPTLPLVDGQTYYAESNIGNCPSISRLAVTVSIVNPNNAGSSAERRFCISDIPATPPFNLFGQLGGTPDATGTWSGPLPTSNGNLGTVDVSTLTVAGSPYVFTYSVSSAPCATATSTVTIVVLPLPTASISVTSGSVCSGASSTVNFTGTPGATVVYNVSGLGNSNVTLSAGGTASITTSYVNTTTYTLISVASAGPPSCSRTLSGNAVTINVIALPTVTVNSPSVCIGSNATVTATPGSPGNYSFAWTVPVGATAPGNVPTFTTSVAGTYSVIITNTTTTCASLSASGTVTINQLPTVTVNSPTVCPGFNATLQANPGTLGVYSFAWTVPAGATDPGNVPAFTTQIAGTYSVVITNTSTNCVSASASGTVTISPLPTVTVNSPAVCAGTSATVTATPGTAGNYLYVWTVPSGATPPGNVATFTTSVAGTYSVIIINTSTTCISLSASGTVAVNPLPTVTVNSSSVCAGASASVTATPGTSGAYSYAWTVPAGATPPGNVATFNTTVAGTYSVIITDTATTCPSLSASGVVTINPIPTVTVNSPSICPGETATITATPGIAGAYSYVWTVPAGATPPGNVATFTTTIAGTYSVIITNTSTTCPSTPSSGTVTINPLPTVTVNSPAICPGLTAAITATPGTPGNYSYVWTVPSGATPPGNVATFNTTIAGTYSVIITNTTTNCVSAPASGIVTINPRPTATVNSETVCAGDSTTITATVGAAGNYSYAWTVPPGATPPGNVAGFSATVAGTYTVLVTDLTTTCVSDPASGILTVNPLPTVTIASSVLCAGADSTITATPGTAGNYSYAWTVPTGVPDPGNVTAFTTAIAGTYSVSITDLTTSCVSAGTASVIINPVPTVAVNSPSICPGVDATVIATPGTAGNYSYAWTVPVGANAPGNVATFTTSIVGTYSVIITDLTTTCVSLSASGIVSNNILPTVTVNSSSVCAGANATVTATPGTGTVTDYSYSWTVPAGATPPGNVATFTTTVAGNYSVVITNITTTCISNPASGTVTVNPLPTVTVNSPSVCAGLNAVITATPGTGTATDYSYSWTVPAGATPPGNVAAFSTTVGGTYSVVITNLTTSCPSASASGLVTINPLPTASISSSGTVCSGTAASILFTGTPNSNVVYTINSTTTANISIGPSGIATLNIPLTVTTTFTLVSITLINPPGCTQTITGASTTMTVTQPPAAGSNANLPICGNAPPQDLFNLLGASAQPGGTWSPVLHSGTNIFDPAFDAAGGYVYTVAGTPPCVNDTALVTVTIIPAPNAGLDGTANLCSNVDPVDLTTYLGGTPQTGGTWTPALASGTNMFDPMVDPAGPYTYTVVGTGSCGNDTAVVTVNITQGPNAGASASTTLCLNSTPINLFPLLGTTAEAGGTWSPALASGTDLFDPAVDAAGPYVYTLSGNQPCDNDTATITVTVNPLPDAGDSASTNICSNANPVDLLTRLGGTPQDGGTWTPALASGTNMFDPSVDAAGSYTYTVGAPFCTPDISTLTINIVAGPEAGLPGAITFCITDPAQNLFDSLGGTPQNGGTWTPTLASGTGLFDPAVDAAGVYTYTLSGNQPCDNDTATVTVTVNPIPNAGTFTGVQNVCNSQGTFDLNTLLNGAQTGGVWTDSNAVTISNIVDVSTLAEATYNFTYTITNTCGTNDESVQFTILPNPVLLAANIGVSSPNCLGDNVTVTFNGMVDGAYVLNYNLSISNNLTNQNAPVTISGGTGTFTINANDLLNTGNTRITFLNITNATTSCTVPINPNVSADFIIRPTSDLDSTNLNIANTCSGTSATVLITGATGLTDGNYQFVYSIPTGIPNTDTTGIIAIAGGAGQFTIPAATINSAGNYTVTITSIVNLSGGCNNLTENANASFTVYALPNLSNGFMSAATSCLNFSNDVTLTSIGGSVLADGNYTITYDLSGAVTATHTVNVLINSNEGVFTIPAIDLNTAGNVTVTITQITSVVGLCNAATIGIAPITFEVTPLVETPVLVPDGENFCAPENPTVADLTSNVIGAQNVVWYDAPTGGTAYASTDLLIDGTIYYGAYVSATGCESPTRLPVQVDLDQCSDILIPDGFSPNGDNINDDFEIPGLATRYPNFKLEIYNRYGNILYKGNINTPNWDGNTSESGMNFSSGALPVGVYFYILEFNDGIKDAKQGRLYLSR